jgi:hypothetical protein
VIKGKDFKKMQAAAWREMRKGRYSCGVYVVEGELRRKVYDLERLEDGGFDIWRGEP